MSEQYPRQIVDMKTGEEGWILPWAVKTRKWNIPVVLGRFDIHKTCAGTADQWIVKKSDGWYIGRERFWVTPVVIALSPRQAYDLGAERA